MGQSVLAQAPPASAVSNLQSKSAETIEVSIRAHIDGLSEIHIQNNQLWWRHLDHNAPGKHSGADEATFVNGYSWPPSWPFGDQTSGCPCDSDKLDLSLAGLQLNDDLELLDLRLISARDSASIVQAPSIDNEFHTIIELNDNPSGGAEWYEVIVVFANQGETGGGNPPILSVTVVAASDTYPPGTSFDADSVEETYTSMTDDPLGPFSGQSVTFRGTGSGGVLQVFKYRLDYEQVVTLDSILVEGAAWRIDEIRLLDEQENVIKAVALEHPNGSNTLHQQVLDVSGVTGRTFFLEESNEDSTWRYRSKIEVFVAGQAPDTSITVPGTSNPWLAGMPDGSTAAGGDVAPDQSPVLATSPFSPGVPITFSVTGLACNADCPGDGPDGGTEFQFHVAENGLPDSNMPLNALAGVFLNTDRPDLIPPPLSLFFDAAGNVVGGINYSSLSPQLRQVFFIGDGQTAGGNSQAILPPDGATRLYLGVMDGSQYNNNSGAFEVVISETSPPANQMPTAIDDAVDVQSGSSVDINVLENDQGLSDTPVSVAITSPPSNGMAAAGADNLVTYTPTAGFSGTDSFEYTVTDKDGDTSIATVNVMVVPLNSGDSPLAADDDVYVVTGGNVIINVLANDQGLADEPITVSILTDPYFGSAFVLDSNRISYTADFGFLGNDDFQYTVADRTGETSNATVRVVVSAPVAADTSVDTVRPKGGGAVSPIGLFCLLSILICVRSRHRDPPLSH